MKKGTGCLVGIIGGITLMIVSDELSRIIAGLVYPYVSTHTFNLIDKYLSLVIIIVIGGILNLIILPYFRRRFF